MEDEVGELSYKNEQLQNQIGKLGKQLSDVHELLQNKEDIQKEFEEKTNASDILVRKLKRENEVLSKKIDSLMEKENPFNNVERDYDTNQSNARKNYFTDDVEQLTKEIEHLI